MITNNYTILIFALHDSKFIGREIQLKNEKLKLALNDIFKI